MVSITLRATECQIMMYPDALFDEVVLVSSQLDLKAVRLCLVVLIRRVDPSLVSLSF